jgi:5-methylcytosine-specific restriction endonuclease McrA
MSITVTELKVCLKCELAYPLNYYRVEMKRGKPYRRPYCKGCARKQARDRYAADPEYFKQRNAVWQKENKEYIAAKLRRLRRTNTEQKKATRAAVPRPENIVLISALRQTLRQWNPEKDRAAAHNARAKKLGAKGRITFLDIYAKLLEQDFFCYLCGTMLEDDYHVDHIAPLAKGGRNDAANISIACSHCNWAKCNHELEEFISFGKQVSKGA